MADHKEAKYLLVVGDAINYIDSSGEEMLHHLVAQLRESGVELVFSGLKKQVLDVMRATGLYNLIGEREHLRYRGSGAGRHLSASGRRGER